MITLFTLDTISSSPAYVTIGSFDGVHLGHQALIRHLVKTAHEAGKEAVVLTFWPHPSMFFHRASAGHVIASPEDRETLIKQLGIDRIFTLRFDEALSNVNASKFVHELKTRLEMVRLIVGPNFALGKNRTGNIEELTRLGSPLDIHVEVFPPVKLGNQIISSSQIRQDLRGSKIREANKLLGREFSVTGRVVHGEHRGAKIGIPTANLQLPGERLVPGNGVYVTRAVVDGKSYDSVTNIGVRPTFDHPLEIPRIEPHLLDMKKQIYNAELTLEFIDFIRPEEKFANADELVTQIKKDIETAREVLSNEA